MPKKPDSESTIEVDQRMFKCEVCGEGFWIKSKLDKHILTHAEIAISCNKCDESFSSCSEAELHSRVHKTDQLYQCSECKKQFAEQSELMYHMLVSHPKQPNILSIEKRAVQAHSTNVPENFKTTSGANFRPKIVQVRTIPENSKLGSNPIIFGLVSKSSASPKSSSSFASIEPALKTPNSLIVKKFPVSGTSLNDVDPKHSQLGKAQKSLKRISNFTQESPSPRKQQKLEFSKSVKQGNLKISASESKFIQSQPLRVLPSTPKSNDLNVYISGEKCNVSSQKASVATEDVKVGRTFLHPVRGQSNVDAEKQLVSPAKSVIYAVNLNQPSPMKSWLINKTPDKKIDTAKQNISVSQVKASNTPKIIMNLPQQAGVIQPGQQLIPASLFAGKAFVLQKSPNANIKDSDTQMGNLAQFPKQRVLLKPVQPVVLASPAKQLLPSQKLQQKADVQNASSKSNSSVNSKSFKDFELAPAKNLIRRKSEISISSDESASPVKNPPPLMSRAPVTRNGRYGKKCLPKKAHLDSSVKVKESQAKNNFSSQNSIELGKFNSLEILPSVSLEKLPDSLYKECIKNGGMNVKNLQKKVMVKSKKAQKQESTKIKLCPVSTKGRKHNAKVTPSDIIEKEKVVLPIPRRTRRSVKECSDVQINKLEDLEGAINKKTCNLHSRNTKSLISHTRKARKANKVLSNQQAQNIKSGKSNISNDYNIVSTTLMKDKPSSRMAVLRNHRGAKPKETHGNEIRVSGTKRSSRNNMNVACTEQGSSSVQVQKKKCDDGIAIQHSKSTPGENVQTKASNIVNAGIKSSPVKNYISKQPLLVTPLKQIVKASASVPIANNVSTPTSSNVKSQILKTGIDSRVGTNNILTSAPTTTPSNLKVVPVSADFLKKLKESLFKNSSCVDSNNIRVVVPSEVLSKIQVPVTPAVVNTIRKTIPKNSESPVVSSTPVPFVKPLRSNIKNFENVDEMLQDEERKREEKEKIKKKEKILKKMLAKYEEKEERKQVKYFQKKLHRFIEKNRHHLQGSEGKLYEVVSNSSRILEELKGLKHASESEVLNQLVTNLLLNSLENQDSSGKSVDKEGEKKVQQKKSVQGFVNLSPRRAEKKSITNSTLQKGKKKITKVSQNAKPKNIFSSNLSNDDVYVYDASNEIVKADQVSYSKSGNVKKILRNKSFKQKRVIKPYNQDPFTDMSIITGETFTIQCPCEKENCSGLHPEMTFL